MDEFGRLTPQYRQLLMGEEIEPFGENQNVQGQSNGHSHQEAIRALALARSGKADEAAAVIGSINQQSCSDREMALIYEVQMLLSQLRDEPKPKIIQYAENAVARFPGSLFAQRFLAMVDEGIGNWASASARYERILEYLPGNQVALREYARLLLRQGRNKAAKEIIQHFDSPLLRALYRLSRIRSNLILRSILVVGVFLLILFDQTHTVAFWGLLVPASAGLIFGVVKKDRLVRSFMSYMLILVLVVSGIRAIAALL